MHYKKLLFVVIFSVLFSSCNILFFKNDLPQIMGLEKIEVENVKKLNEWTGEQGEGITLEVYRISQNNIRTFEDKSVKNLPDKKDGKEWQKYDWHTLPVDSSYKGIFTMGLNYSGDNNNVRDALDEIKKLIGFNNNYNIYYSFYYRPDKENPQNVQLFILDVENRKLYAVNR